VKARKYERSPQRQGNGRGHKARSLAARYPLLEKLQLPPIAEGPIDFQRVDIYQPRRSEVDAAIGTLDDELQHLQTKPLTDDFSFLWLDGIAQKVSANGVEKKVMLCSLGLKEDGTNEMLAFRLVDREDTDGWRAFLEDIKSRGLQGKALKLITTDDNPGLLKALKETYSFLKVQRCIVLKLRNVAVTLKRVHRKRCMAEAKDIFNAPSRSEATKCFRAWQEKWQAEEEKAVRCLANDFHHCLHYYSFPEELWKKIRSTNMLEREFRDVRRRTRPTGSFSAEPRASV